MVIRSIEIFRLRLPLRSPWVTAAGTETYVETLYVHGIDRDGIEAWVESCPLATPTYLPETAGTAFVVCRDVLAQRVIGRDLQSPESINALFADVRGNSFAKAAIEMLWWQLQAARLTVPLQDLIGGTDRAITLGRGVPIADNLDDLLTKVDAALAAGAARIKLKIQPGIDIEPVRAVRDGFPEVPLHVDANGSYTLQDVDLFRQLDPLNLVMIEQPLPWRDLADHATLQRQLQTAICLDESVVDQATAEQALRLGSCRVINLKPGRLGGITPLIAIHDQCQDAGVACWIGSMLETGLGATISANLATLPNCTLANEIPTQGRFYEREPCASGPIMQAGKLIVSDLPPINRLAVTDLALESVRIR